MKIECRYDPDDLIDQIGDRYFNFDEDRWNNEGRALIIDCEGETWIEIHSCFGSAETVKAVHAMLNLLNQEYEFKEEK